ncbi:MAG TPA: N-formylglutamate amidohydrolase [Casimicrobiaceae bacterium]|jgi:N-formylglutamate amidohydrolase
MTAPVIVHRPSIAAALVLDSPHSGEWYPPDFDHAPPRAEVRQAEDTHVARLWRGALAHGATLVEAVFPRAYIDPNRSLADIDPALFADGERWPHPLSPSRKTEQGIGLVWRLARHGVPLYARKLGVAEVAHRIDAYWRPYHAALAAAIDECHDAFGAAWHLDCHSMPAVGDALADDPGRARADIVLGDRDGTTCDPAFTAQVRDLFAARGYSVAINDPYKGVEIVRRHGQPGAARHSLQVEINRRLYMDETTLLPHAGHDVLARDLAGIAADLVAWIKPRLRPSRGPARQAASRS